MGLIAIITARGGSKRIPRKNIRDFCGKPMIAYAIGAAVDSGIFDEVMVSTDDREIAAVSKEYGARVPFMRSAGNSDDFATTADVLREVLSAYLERGRVFDSLCCLYPCVPLLTAATLRKAHSRFAGCPALIPVCSYPVPIEWALDIKDTVLVPHDMRSINTRSQDLTPKYHDAGMFYFSTAASFSASGSLFPEGTRAFVMDRLECHDIDTPEDWAAAELIAKAMGMGTGEHA